MPWKSKEKQYADGSEEITYNYFDDNNRFTQMTILINISTKLFDTFSLVMLEGIKSFKARHPRIIPEEMGYMDKLQKCLKIGVLDNGAGPKSTYITDYRSAKDLPAGVKHTVYQRKQTLLNIIHVLAKHYEFSKEHQYKLEQLIQKSFTFLGAVTMAKSRIENAKIYRSVAFDPPGEQLEKLRAKKLGADAINLRSAMDKLLLFAAGEKFENFTPEEIEILTTEEKFIPVLRDESSWLICLHKEFKKEMAAAEKNEALPSESTTQSYADIQSAILSKAEEKEEKKEEKEEIKPVPAVESKKPRTSRQTEATPLIQRKKPAKPEREPEEEAPCISCTIL